MSEYFHTQHFSHMNVNKNGSLCCQTKDGSPEYAKIWNRRGLFSEGHLEEGQSTEVRGHGQRKMGDIVNGPEQRGNVITRK